MTWDDPSYIEQLTEIRELAEQLAAATARADAAESKLTEVEGAINWCYGMSVLADFRNATCTIEPMVINVGTGSVVQQVKIDDNKAPLDALLQAVKGLRGDVK